MKKYILPLAVIVFFAETTSLRAEDTTFPVPMAAYEVRHVILEGVGTTQDNYKMRLAYPSMAVVEHYRALFRGWWECSDKHGWESFADHAIGKSEYIHQLIYYWVSPTNDKVVTLGIRYVSPGIETRKEPTTHEQRVFVLLNEPVKNAKAETEQRGVLCALRDTAAAPS